MKKFRVRDKYNNIQFPFLHELGLYDFTTGEFRLEQFTGLKDKNGKEIYEGDKIKIQGGIKEYIGEVYFAAGAFMIKGFDLLWFGAKDGVYEAGEIINEKI